MEAPWPKACSTQEPVSLAAAYLIRGCPLLGLPQSRKPKIWLPFRCLDLIYSIFRIVISLLLTAAQTPSSWLLHKQQAKQMFLRQGFIGVSWSKSKRAAPKKGNQCVTLLAAVYRAEAACDAFLNFLVWLIGLICSVGFLCCNRACNVPLWVGR